uniref:Putative F-box domain, cyclin-like protein n=1 Tax=Davidia involucrata TaxID=16924 RepID=A0A5B6ZIL3_DAVIN
MDKQLERGGVGFSEREKKMVRMKVRNRAEEEEEQPEDRLSNLPDSLIHYIFSFMDTKFVAQTCVLSTRFKHLWTSVPNLNFQSCYFPRVYLFTKFVSRVLSRRDSSSNVSTLNFVRGGIVERRHMKRIINFAIHHNVQQLNITVSVDRDPSSLSLIFNSKSLVNLKLIFCHFQNLPNSLNLTALTTLHLEKVSFSISNDKSNKCFDPFSNCLNLKNLTLINCFIRGLDVFTIGSPQLAKLTLSFCCGWEDINRKFVVTAPKLSCFHLDGFPPLELSADNVPSLETVQVSVSRSSNEDKEDMVALINVLKELRNAKFVTLDLDAIKILSMVPSLLEHQPSPFTNLKSLKVRSTTSTIPDHVMSYLLNCSPSAAVVVGFQ